MRRRIGLVVAVLGCSATCRGEEPGHAQSLFLLDTAYPQERGSVQLTVAPTHLHASDWEQTSLEARIEYGLTDRLTVEASVPWLWVSEIDPDDGVSSAHGVGDAGVAVMASVLEPDGHVVLSLGAEIGIPTGDDDRELGEGRLSAGPRALLAWDVGGSIAHAGLGLEFASGEAAVEYGLAIERPVGDVSLVAEFTGRIERGRSEAYITPGVVWRFSERAEFGAGIPIGLGGDSADLGVAAQLTVEF